MTLLQRLVSSHYCLLGTETVCTGFVPGGRRAQPGDRGAPEAAHTGPSAGILLLSCRTAPLPNTPALSPAPLTGDIQAAQVRTPRCPHQVAASPSQTQDHRTVVSQV